MRPTSLVLADPGGRMGFSWPEAVLITGPDTLAGYAPQRVISRFVGTASDGGTVRWQEAGHGRVRTIRTVLRDEPDHFEFIDDQGRTFCLAELTLERYDRHVRAHTMGKVAFVSQRAMLDAMRVEW